MNELLKKIRETTLEELKEEYIDHFAPEGKKLLLTIYTERLELLKELTEKTELIVIYLEEITK